MRTHHASASALVGAVVGVLAAETLQVRLLSSVEFTRADVPTMTNVLSAIATGQLRVDDTQRGDRDYVVSLRFADGKTGEIDLGPHLWGPVFEPHKDVNTDVAPEFLHENVTPAAEPAETP